MAIRFNDTRTVTQQTREYSFGCDGKGARVEVSVRPTTSGAYKILLEGVFAAVLGKVTLYGLGELVEHSLEEHLRLTIQIRAWEHDAEGNESLDQRIELGGIYCKARVPIGFSYDWPLTMRGNVRITCEGAREELYLWDAFAMKCKVIAEYYGGSKLERVVTEVTPRLTLDEGAGEHDIKTGVPGLYKLDVSPYLYSDSSLGRLLCLTLVLEKDGEQRVVRYTIRPGDAKSSFIFRNSFGVPEYLYCYGPTSEKYTYERGSALLNGIHKSYGIKETKNMTAHTGVMTEDTADWVPELLRSEMVFAKQGSLIVPVVVTECKAERDGLDHELVQYTFDYKYAEEGTVFFTEEEAKARIFDDTFDNTYG